MNECTCYNLPKRLCIYKNRLPADSEVTSTPICHFLDETKDPSSADGPATTTSGNNSHLSVYVSYNPPHFLVP